MHNSKQNMHNSPVEHNTYMFSSSLTPALTQLFFQKPLATFSRIHQRLEMKIRRKKRVPQTVIESSTCRLRFRFVTQISYRTGVYGKPRGWYPLNQKKMTVIA